MGVLFLFYLFKTDTLDVSKTAMGKKIGTIFTHCKLLHLSFNPVTQFSKFHSLPIRKYTMFSTENTWQIPVKVKQKPINI